MLHLCSNKAENANKLIRKGGLKTSTWIIPLYNQSHICRRAQQNLVGMWMWWEKGLCMSAFNLSFQPKRQPRAEDEGLFHLLVETALSQRSKENIHTLALLPWSNLPFISVQTHFTLLLSVFIFSDVSVSLFIFLTPSHPSLNVYTSKFSPLLTRVCSRCLDQIIKSAF